ncbi:hypothetical protein GY45DRAFT_1038823 [Cubamyces sp. BRFM 1775]|nr:hypothetical protein GY45DRAFT_1038823 [Cubamyces sp. BRFM 1775]
MTLPRHPQPVSWRAISALPRHPHTLMIVPTSHTRTVLSPGTAQLKRCATGGSSRAPGAWHMPHPHDSPGSARHIPAWPAPPPTPVRHAIARV